MLGVTNCEFNKIYNKYIDMSNNNYDLYDEYQTMAHEFLTNIQLSSNQNNIKKEIKFICKYPSLLEFQSAVKIQKWWDRMRAKLLALNYIKYQQCEDCGKWRLKYQENIRENELMKTNACADYITYMHNCSCCIKYVCHDKKCSFVLFCCNNITIRDYENLVYDNDNCLTIKCNHCNLENDVKLTWFGMTSQEHIDKYF